MLKSLPLKKRVFRTSLNPSTLASQSQIHRPEKYKMWNEDQMQKALESVHEGRSVRRAAEEYGVPRATLGDRASGRVKPGAVSGLPKYLNTDEELVKFLLRCASIGYPRSRKDVIALVQRINESRRITGYVTNGWWESFCKRHPNLTLRATVPLSHARAKATDPEMLGHYFYLLEQTLAENGLEDKPMQILNVDETEMPLNAKCQRGIYKVGERNPAAITSGDKTLGKVLSRYSFSKVFSQAWTKAMTIRNIVSGFKVTGVYPVDRYALVLPEESRESLATSSGLAFIPLLSHAKPRLHGVTQRDDVLTFSQKELQLFETRYENGYDLPVFRVCSI